MPKPLKAIKQDVLKIGNLELVVAVLEDGQRVIEQQSLIKFFDDMGKDREWTEKETLEFCKKLKTFN